VTRAIENAQRKVENRNFDIRKQLLEYDDVANDQRKVIYEQRNELLDAEDISAYITDVRTEVVETLVEAHVPKDSVEEQWTIPGLTEALEQELGLKLDLAGWLAQDTSMDEEGLRQRVIDAAQQAYAEKEQTAGETVMRHFEKAVMLQILDNHWKEHLSEMDYLRQGIHLRGFAGKNAKQEYKREAFEMFSRMLDAIKREVIGILAKVQVRDEAEVEALEEQRRHQQELPMEFMHADAQSALSGPEEAMPEFGADPDAQQPQTPMPQQRAPRTAPFVRDFPKVGRNDPCPCGSGKKYKQCHGALT
jgi:preprotein translocase subunit SecA